MALLNSSTLLCQSIYGYDNASRLATVSDGVDNTATYSYLANSSLVGQIMFNSNTVARMTTSKQYDYLNRLSSIASTPSNSFAYLYNSANQRTMDRLWDGSYWRYGYDSLGQVIQGEKYWVDETVVAGQQFGYTFDTIGNRTQTQAGGDQNGANLRVANYTNNNLNQVTSRGVPAYVDIMGDGLATNGVTVNGLAAYRKYEYFRQQLSVTNTSAVWDSITVAATNQGSITGHVYVPQYPENYTYDADGNLLSDGRWNYTWDAENRLLSMTSLSGAPSGSQLQLNFAYDYVGRRIQKAVAAWSGSAYTNAYTYKYAYDGWNCIALLNSSFSILNSFMWGTDLSGGLQGAGGVGGLLKVAYYGASTTNCFVAYDGNGNVSALVNAANGATVANYEYGPFGEVIRATGPMAKVNPFRFSTGDTYEGEQNDPLSLHKYLYVADNPVNGTDPTGHAGVFNFTDKFGNRAHAAIESAYQAEHPGAIVGPTTGVLGTSLKPDIFDGISRTYMEIKPLSLSGVAKGVFQIGVYSATFNAFNLGYSRGTWPNGVRSTYVGLDPIAYFNVQGIIFYTDMTDNLDDLATISTVALARQFIIQNSALLTRTLSGIMVRIPGLAVSAQVSDNARLGAMEGIATLDSLMGAP